MNEKDLKNANYCGLCSKKECNCAMPQTNKCCAKCLIKQKILDIHCGIKDCLCHSEPKPNEDDFTASICKKCSTEKGIGYHKCHTQKPEEDCQHSRWARKIDCENCRKICPQEERLEQEKANLEKFAPSHSIEEEHKECPSCGEDLCDFLSKEIERAREEEYAAGYKYGLETNATKFDPWKQGIRNSTLSEIEKKVGEMKVDVYLCPKGVYEERLKYNQALEDTLSLLTNMKQGDERHD